MKSLVIYGSTRGNTRTVASRLPDLLAFPADFIDVSTLKDAEILQDYQFLMFLASTWGDGELQIDMENFLAHHALRLDGKYYAICELGNYYGYDDFEFGALRIMRHHLEKGGGRELIEPFSMDSLPRKDWNGLTRWCKLLNEKMAENTHA